MYELEDYKKLIEFIRNNEFMMDEIQSIIHSDVEEPILYERNGKEFDLTKNWESEIHRYDEDKPEYWSWQFDQSDEYCIYLEGYYDSWGGSSIESEYEIGKIGKVVIEYKSYTTVS